MCGKTEWEYTDLKENMPNASCHSHLKCQESTCPGT